ncbi:hypothetical protein [Mesorhizobium sp. LSHC422A00]|nr:hypothetical protein [Mesorhizobium sp. LSHC422A00]
MARDIDDAVAERRILDGEVAAIIIVLDIDDDERAARRDIGGHGVLLRA